MRASKTAVVAGFALLTAIALPISTAMSAAALPPAPTTLGLDDLQDSVEKAKQKATGTVDGGSRPVQDAVPPPEEPTATEAPPSEPAPQAPSESVPAPAPPPVTTHAPAPTATMQPIPAPEPTQSSDDVSGTDPGGSSEDGGADAGGDTGSTPDSGVGTGGGSGAGTPSVPAPGQPTRETTGTQPDEAPGSADASPAPRTSSTSYQGAPLRAQPTPGIADIRSLLLADRHRTEAITPVADGRVGSILGLIVLGTVASLMLFGSAAYLKFGKRRPATGRHKG